MMDKWAVLERYFGYTTFRHGQEALIDALLEGRDAVGIMPTGAGKSLCFQVPALLLPGITLVISPLISLMKDQVGALRQSGVPVALLNSSLQAGEQRQVLEEAEAGAYKLIYVAPERLDAPDFLQFARSAPISFVAVDEAHCVSQWGQDFRPSYLRIREFLSGLRQRPVVGAFTATATDRIRQDMVELLDLDDPLVMATSFDRSNLYYEVQAPRGKFAALLEFLKTREDRSGIVYCLTRKTVESTCRQLCDQGYAATRYHAGLSPEERRENQERFQEDAARIMVATNAFGMGIDKSNVSYVVHFNMPKNLESYYQEAGRAGRDGSPAECLLFYSGQDVQTNRFFIEKAEDNEEMDAEMLAQFKEYERERLKQMTFYCHTRDCLRAYILRYFGETRQGGCGNCGNCLQTGEQEDITVEAQKILSCVKRMGERYGVKLLLDTLRGSKSQRVEELGFTGLSTYGIMRGTDERQLRDMVSFLLAQGYLAQSNGDYPVITLGPNARPVLFEGAGVSMNKSPHRRPESEGRPERKRRSVQQDIANPRLYSKLQSLRAQLAKEQSVPAYIVFPDVALRDMCHLLPTTMEQFAQVNGVGAMKLKKYGARFLEVIREEAEPSPE